MTTEAERNGEIPREAAGAPPGAADTPSEAAESPPADEQELHQAAQTDLSLLAEAARFATPERVRAAVEALLFAADKPLDLAVQVLTMLGGRNTRVDHDSIFSPRWFCLGFDNDRA